MEHVLAPLASRARGPRLVTAALNTAGAALPQITAPPDASLPSALAGRVALPLSARPRLPRASPPPRRLPPKFPRMEHALELLGTPARARRSETAAPNMAGAVPLPITVELDATRRLVPAQRDDDGEIV